MKNYVYEIDAVNKSNNGFVVHKILETQTRQYIAEAIPHPEVKFMTGRLNSGYGFNGWTPQFFLYKIKP